MELNLESKNQFCSVQNEVIQSLFVLPNSENHERPNSSNEIRRKENMNLWDDREREREKEEEYGKLLE